ncbi:ImuA family protein [Sphingomonas sp. GB1N7]|uniref:ImuA family protein n=1 Tax=Parasphingomonas caseinilytica TaxID=3096158 RepID=UPI002FC75C75
MRDSVEIIAALRRHVSQLEGLRQTETSGFVGIGHEEIDARLGGGLERGRVHEIFALNADDVSSAAGFAAMIVRRAGLGSVVWLRQDNAQGAGGALHMPGIIELGLRGLDLIVGMLPDALSLLCVAADVTRCADVAMVVVELWQNPRMLDLTASRRLAMAAESSGVTALLLRVAAEPSPSAATTRWQVRSAAAVPLAANAPGFPTLDVELSRQRGGKAGGRWCVEWDRDEAIFRPAGYQAAALSGAVVSVSAGGPGGARRRAG